MARANDVRRHSPSTRRQHNLSVKVARIFNTYGPRMHPNDGRVVSNFIVQALKNQPITIFGEGHQTRSFCYVDDLIEAFIRLMGTSESFTGPVNLGNPDEFTIRQLAELVIELTNSSSKLLNKLNMNTEWVLLLDADEVVPKELWDEIACAISKSGAPDAFLITKGFHFLGRRFRFGGFSHSAVLLFRQGKAEFEELDSSIATAHDMEVHERMIVDGAVGVISTPLIHEDFKGLTAYIDRHNPYSTWEAGVRFS